MILAASQNARKDAAEGFALHLLSQNAILAKTMMILLQSNLNNHLKKDRNISYSGLRDLYEITYIHKDRVGVSRPSSFKKN